MLALAAAPAAHAQGEPPTPELEGMTPMGPDVQRLEFSYGPIHVSPGQNLILVGPVTIEKPGYDGYITRFQPDLVRSDGSVPPVDVIHLHHGVWLNMTGRDLTSPGLPERIAASGEEKTIFQAPTDADGAPRYGYPVEDTDVWAINYMLHNQTVRPENVWITYTVDYVAKDSELGRRLEPIRPVWLDVCNGQAYPVFDVKRRDGAGGRYTFPDQSAGVEASRRECTNGASRESVAAPGDGTLVWSGGHVHPGGLRTDLHVDRGSASAHAFASEARYFDDPVTGLPRPPVSWDMAMTVTPRDWEVGVRAGDRLRVSATYETELASWYESMGIMIAYWDPVDRPGERPGPDPFVSPPPTTGEPTHGSLPENRNFGGDATGLPDPRELPDGQTLDRRVGIFGFVYTPGDIGGPGSLGLPPVVERGEPLRFGNADAAAQVYHSITACAAPCNRSTGIGYPLADGPGDFDSGELGYGPRGYTAAANRAGWDLDTRELSSGTYTYFCRVHPFMRGSFRVKDGATR